MSVAREADRRVLILGVYLPDQPNRARALSDTLLSARDWRVELRWAAVGAGAARSGDPVLDALTRQRHPERIAKFVLINRLLAEAARDDYRYLIVVDDDIELEPDFLDRFLAIQTAHAFTLAQPARTHDSYIDHYFVAQLLGVEARLTRFVEIGPLFSLHRDGFGLLLPFDESAPMGWGLDFVWPVVLGAQHRRLGIVDATPVRHALRKPVSHYDYASTAGAMTDFLARHPHLPPAEAFLALQSFPLASGSSAAEPSAS